MSQARAAPPGYSFLLTLLCCLMPTGSLWAYVTPFSSAYASAAQPPPTRTSVALRPRFTAGLPFRCRKTILPFALHTMQTGCAIDHKAYLHPSNGQSFALAVWARACLMDRFSFVSLFVERSRRVGGTRGDGRKGRTDRQSLGADCAAVAPKRPTRWTLEGSPPGHKWHPLETENRSTLARLTEALRAVANLLRPIRALEARWHLGSALGSRADQIGRSR